MPSSRSPFPIPGAPPTAAGSGTPADDPTIPAPALSLPKGGGAIQGIGEKLQANPVTGSANLTLPLPTTPARGLAPSLALTYDSGAANGPFGLGWHLSLPTIQRRTSKGLPRYRNDGDDADTFVLSDVEDLVPLLTEASPGVWQVVSRTDTLDAEAYTVQRYRPRVGGDTLLIERWTRDSDRRVHWRTVSSGNVSRRYGRTDSATLRDPRWANKVFAWYLEETRDELGNVVSYRYKHEDRAGVPSMAAEAHRAGAVAYAYLKEVRWGNTAPGQNPDAGGTGQWRFSLVLDYGEHDADDPQPDDTGTWAVRDDIFSSFRPGFDQRCYRLVQRVLLFHHFASLRSGTPTVVRSLELTHTSRATLTTLDQVQVRGWVWDPSASAYVTEVEPPVSFTTTEPEIDPSVHRLEGLDGRPFRVDTRAWRFVDLDGEGLVGLLSEQGGAWTYKRNEGEGRFAPARRLSRKPSVSLASAGVRLADVDGDGNLDVVVMNRELSGTWARSEGGDGFERFQAFDKVPTDRLEDPDARLLDLTGDGRPDLLVSRDRVYTWYPSQARKGYGAPRRVPMATDQAKGPRQLFSRDGEMLFLADMTGDGLTDLVRIRHGGLCYWPNLGYGRFGAQVRMQGAPRWPRHRFDPSRIKLADVDGSGPTDLLVLHARGVTVWLNQAGNGFTEGSLVPMPAIVNPSDVQVVDVHGDGTACLVWSSSLLKDQGRPVRYVRLLSQGKPWLLSKVDNHRGREVHLTYTASTAFYLADRRAGRPWATRLPFPVQCLTKVETLDQVTGWRHAQTMAYHHGTYDGREREFRGFGMVEQWDAEDVQPDDPELGYQPPPVRTRTWYHTGVWGKEQALWSAYAAETTTVDATAPWLGEPTLPPASTPEARAQAHRALRGRVLRTEVYTEDGEGGLATLVSVSEQGWTVHEVQPPQEGSPGAFRVDARESLSRVYEHALEGTDPVDPRSAHTLTLEVDAYGVVLRSASVSYPRRGSSGTTEQHALTVVVTEQEVVHDDSAPGSRWHIGVPTRAKTWELTGTSAWTDDTNLATPSAVASAWSGSSGSVLAWEEEPTTGLQRRLLSHGVQTYWNDTLTGPLAVGTLGSRALLYEQYALALTSGLVSDVYGSLVTSGMLTSAGYVDLASDGDRWAPSGRLVPDASLFYRPERHIDPWGEETSLTWDADGLVLEEVTNAAGLTVEAVVDYRLLSPSSVTDANGTVSVATYDALGRVTSTAVRNPEGSGHGDGASEVSTQYTYETSRWSTLGLPNRVKVEVRESFGGSAWQTSWAYSDGGGEVVQTKSRVASGLAPERDGTTGELVYDGGELQWALADPRYVGSGRVVRNHKGLVIRQYEPFFSSVFEYEPEDEVAASGVASDTTYDALGRAVRVDLPDGSQRSWTYGPWVQAAYDEEDNDATGDHHDTPVVTSLDSLGRTSRVYETPDGGSHTYETRVTHDVVGHPVEVVDPRGITIQAQTFDLLGRALFTGASDEGWVSGGPDKGRTRVFFDVAGQPVRTWRSGGLTLGRTYDVLRRPVALYVDEGSGERLAELLFYGDALTDAGAFSAGRVVRVYDPAGEVRRSYDFLGRTTQETRRVCEDVTAEPDWTALSSCTSASAIDAVLGTGGSLEGELESETYAVDTAYDALGRVTSQQSPTVGTLTRHTTLPGYDEGGRLSSVQVQVHGATATSHVSSVTYNARGQREKVVYGNNTETRYTYDAERFWLTEQETVRDPGGTPVKLQDLSYTHDRVGNILQIEDDSQATLWFANTQVDPTRTFTYDDQYRLVTAQGREKQGLTQTGPVEPPMGGLPGGPGTLVLRRYTQSYTYDAAGNFVEMKHQNGDFGTVLWRRGYLTSSASNQLERSSRPGDDYSTPSSYSDVYGYNDRGAMTFLPHLKSGVSANVARDYRDMLRQADLDSDDNQAWFTYDGGLQRVRKVVEKGAATEDRIYVGPFEVWRVRKSGSVREERLTLHVMDGQTRISMVETKTVANGSAVTPLAPRTRFQLTDHLGTATIETDSSGNTITYEEYHPYGSTAWWSEASSLEVSQKRYRYTGKEKDEATGLYYHGARYYAPWLGRWASADPIGLGDGGNRHGYVGGRTISFSDPSGTTGFLAGCRSVNASGYQLGYHEATTLLRVARGESKYEQVVDEGLVIIAMRPDSARPFMRTDSSTFTDSALGSDNALTTDVVVNLHFYDSLPGVHHNVFGGDPISPDHSGIVYSGQFVVGGEIQERSTDSRDGGSIVIMDTMADAYEALMGVPAPHGQEMIQVRFGMGNPNPNADIGAGGLVPVILDGIPMGGMNFYKSGTEGERIWYGEPYPEHRSHLMQRSNLGFVALQGYGPEGLMLVGTDTSGVVYVLAQSTTDPRLDLENAQDVLEGLNVDNAMAFDSGGSAALIVDDQVVVQPDVWRNNTMVSGIRFTVAP